MHNTTDYSKWNEGWHGLIKSRFGGQCWNIYLCHQNGLIYVSSIKDTHFIPDFLRCTYVRLYFVRFSSQKNFFMHAPKLSTKKSTLIVQWSSKLQILPYCFFETVNNSKYFSLLTFCDCHRVFSFHSETLNYAFQLIEYSRLPVIYSDWEMR